MLGKLNIALGDVRNSKKAKKRKGVWSSTGQSYQLHTHWCFPGPGSLHLLSVPCCRFLFFSLQLSDKTLSSNMLPDLIPSIIFSKPTVGQKAEGIIRTNKFFMHPIRNSCNSSRNVYSSNRCYSQYYFFFQMTKQMLAHSLKKAHIKFLLFSISKYWKQLPRDRGWCWQGSSPWFRATTSPHVQSTAGQTHRAVLKASISSVQDTETGVSLGSHTIEQHCEMATHTRRKKRASPEDHH